MKKIIRQSRLLLRIFNVAFWALVIILGCNLISNSKGQIDKNDKVVPEEKNSIADNNLFPNTDYPFLHKDSTKNSLKPFFIPGDGNGKPDIVVIIIESMGKA